MVLAFIWSGLSLAKTTSDESPPLLCDRDRFITELTCTGDYCDNLEIKCESPPALSWGPALAFTEKRAWWSWFFGLGSTKSACPTGSGAIGVSCDGSFCGSVRLLCAPVTGAELAKEIRVTPFFSEEGTGSQGVRTTEMLVGLRCAGSHCDKLALEVLEMRNR